ncbi:PP2C family protein-serine/threonine phosphatase [Streptomyces sp. NPDC015346]|uniref:PP2C family protein-serine/threonine phosphatase n=1 Tax=Streptomyces sp. NPDC015346 TaxID=3364954 RepID=UPI0036FF3514
MSERAEAPVSPVEEHAAALARLRAVAAAIGEIGTRLDERAVCEDLAAFLSRHGYDAAAVDVRPEDGASWVRAAVAGPSELVDHVKPTREDGPGRAYPDAEPDGRPVRVVRAPLEWQGRSLGVVTAVRLTGAPSGPASRVEEHETGLVQDAARTAASRGEEHETGLVQDVARTAASRGEEHETGLVQDVARLAAAHLAHARSLAATERTAYHLQQALVAEPGRPHPNLEIAGRYLPAGARTLVGGDWFETVRLHFGRSLLVVGDVMGHGLDAAVDMNAYRSALRDVASTDLPPHRVLRQLDAVVAEHGTMRPATCLLIQIDPARGAATLASAGHLPPVIFAADGSADLVEVPVGPPLGTGVAGYEPVTRTLSPSDTLLLFTDGLVERRGEDIDVSLARLSTLRLPAGSGPERVVEEVLQRLDARRAEDDVAVLAARIRERHTPQ